MSTYFKDLRRAALAVLARADQISEEHDLAVFAFSNTLHSGHRDTLRQLVKDGPIWDGDILSKSYRDDLIETGLACRCVFRGSQGYTAATYYGWEVHEALIEAQERKAAEK